MPKKRQPQRRRNFLKSLSTASAGVVLAGHSPAVLAAAAPAIGPVPQRKFGRHTQMVSSLALGGATLAKKSSVQEATRIAHAALDMGVTFFDNAWEYANGRAGEWMGVALQGKRDQVFLMTKVCTHIKGQETKEKALAMLEESMRRLKTDHLVLWQVHQILTDTEADSSFKPFTPGEMADLEQRCSSKKQYAYHRRWAYYDGRPPGTLCA